MRKLFERGPHAAFTNAARRDLDANFSDAFTRINLANKPENEPIVIVYTGQSNMVGIYPPVGETMVVNPNVRDWRGTDYQGGSAAFTVATLDHDSSFPGGNNLIVGMRGESGGVFDGNPHAHIAWAFGDETERASDHIVCMIGVSRGGTAIYASEGWDDGGDCEDALATHVPAAIAAINAEFGTNIQYPDVVLWSQGESDRPITDPITYRDRWLAVKANLESKWAGAYHTQWVVFGHSTGYTYWSGMELVDQYTDGMVHYISTEGVGYASGDYPHFDGDGLLQLGRMGARTWLSGQNSKSPVGALWDASKPDGSGSIDYMTYADGDGLIKSGNYRHVGSVQTTSTTYDSVAALNVAEDEKLSGVTRVWGTQSDGTEHYSCVYHWYFNNDGGSETYAGDSISEVGDSTGDIDVAIGDFGATVCLIRVRNTTGGTWNWHSETEYSIDT